MKPDVIIVIGASAGGVSALCELLKAIPLGLPAAILVVLHVGSESRLSAVLSRCCFHSVRTAIDGEPLMAGGVYVAPPSKHLLVRGTTIRLTTDARENYCRPAIDPLFRSASRSFGERTIGVVLTGTRDDGAEGLSTIKSRGGVTVVQSPEEAEWPDMPQNALRYTQPDYCLPIAQMGELLARLSRQRAAQSRQPSALSPLPEAESPELAPRVCPDCGAPLDQQELSNLYPFPTGHAPEILRVTDIDALERSLWITVRTLKEQIRMRERLTRQLAGRGQMDLSERFQKQADAARHDLILIREVLDQVVRSQEPPEKKTAALP